MKIGDILVPAGAGMAPMAGVTDMPARMAAHECGAAYCVTEMLNAKGYIKAPENRAALRAILARSPEEGLLAVQLFGHEPKYMRMAAEHMAEEGFDWIDLNFGCPAPKIVGNGDGSALMREPVLLGRMVEAAARGTSLPVTAKIRIGWDEDSVNAVEIAKICENAGARAITVHGRTRAQQYAGAVSRAVIAEVKQAVRVPVIANGDIFDAPAALSMLADTGCDAVACARGAQGNPWLFAEIKAAMQNQPYASPTVPEKCDLILRHARRLADFKTERVAVKEMRKHLVWYLKGSKNIAPLKIRAAQMTSMSELEAIVETWRAGGLSAPQTP